MNDGADPFRRDHLGKQLGAPKYEGSFLWAETELNVGQDGQPSGSRRCFFRFQNYYILLLPGWVTLGFSTLATKFFSGKNCKAPRMAYTDNVGVCLVEAVAPHHNVLW